MLNVDVDIKQVDIKGQNVLFSEYLNILRFSSISSDSYIDWRPDKFISYL